MLVADEKKTPLQRSSANMISPLQEGLMRQSFCPLHLDEQEYFIVRSAGLLTKPSSERRP